MYNITILKVNDRTVGEFHKSDHEPQLAVEDVVWSYACNSGVFAKVVANAEVFGDSHMYVLTDNEQAAIIFGFYPEIDDNQREELEKLISNDSH